MEVLRGANYASLPAGGSLTSNTTNYFDLSNPEVTQRWSITDNTTPAGTKTITVRVIANRQVIGERKDVTLTMIRGK